MPIDIYNHSHTIWGLNSIQQNSRGVLIMNSGRKSVTPNILIKAINKTITNSIQAQKKIFLAS